jgi:hypothetical protein
MGIQAARSRWTSAAMGLALCGFNGALVYLLIFLLPFQLSQYYTVPQPGESGHSRTPARNCWPWAGPFSFSYITWLIVSARRDLRAARWPSWPSFPSSSP